MVTLGGASFSGTADGRVSNVSVVSLALHHVDRSSFFTYAGAVRDDGMSIDGNFVDPGGRSFSLDLSKE